MRKLGILIAIAIIGASPLLSADLVQNPDFNLGFSHLEGWSLGNSASSKTIPNNAEGVESRNGVHVTWKTGPSGNRYLGMLGKGEEQKDYAIVYSDPIKVLPGFEYAASFRYKASGLMPENGDRSRFAAAFMDIFFNSMKDDRQVLTGTTRILTYNNAGDWVTPTHEPHTFIIPESTQDAQLRLQISNRFPDSTIDVGFDDIVFQPLDPSLPNPGAEAIEIGAFSPKNWIPLGSADTGISDDVVYAGKYSLSVSDAPNGGELNYSGWATEVPVRSDRSYRFGGWIKGGKLQSGGYGAGFCLQYLDRDGQPLQKPIVSDFVEPESDWTQLMTPTSEAPEQAVSARLSACMNFTSGSAWFDDMTLQIDEIEPTAQVLLKREPRASTGVEFARNLLENGTLEQGAENDPEAWEYIGRQDMDWTEAEIDELHNQTRPAFSIGRGRGEWSHDQSYAGEHALLNTSIDPPRSPRNSWYGRNPVDGFWLSDPMPCDPGKAYLAAAWIRPGVYIQEPWLGPLELRFYNAAGTKLYLPPLRAGMAEAPAGVWSWWATLPRIAPQGTVSMRVRFGQEYGAAKGNGGGWGRTFGDNFAVWELPNGATIPETGEIELNTKKFQSWFQSAHVQIKPPYLPAPAATQAYESVWGRMVNTEPGNLFTDPELPISAKFEVFNTLGEERSLSLQIHPTDWRGNRLPKIKSEPFPIKGYSSEVVKIALPPRQNYGAFHLSVNVLENESRVGKLSGRFAVLPPLKRTRTVENIWGAMLKTKITPAEGAYQQELGQILEKGGYGLAWVRMQFPLDPEARDQRFQETLKIIDWYRYHGMRVILQLFPEVKEPINGSEYESAGRAIGGTFLNKVAAIGNYGIEMVNSNSPFRGYGDQVFDTVMAALYDGIKDTAREIPVLVGNIATDLEAKTLHRLYEKTVSGRFDGAILNPYLGLMITPINSLREMDVHGDQNKSVWIEESSAFRAPFEHEQRRYGEADGTRNMARTFISWLRFRPRIKAVTSWSFVSGKDEVYNFVNTVLQPRPQFVAHAVMANALADAEFVADLSSSEVTLFKWRRRNGSLFTLWANAGEKHIALNPTSDPIQVMDLMGNRETIDQNAGKIDLVIDSFPRYISSADDRIFMNYQVTK